MPELRWILIAFGVVLLVAIYVWGRRESDSSRARPRPDPAFESGVDAAEPVIEAEPDPVSAEAREADPVESPVEESSVEPVLEEPRIEPAFDRSERHERFARIEPTLGDDDATAELPADEPEPVLEAEPMQSSDAPEQAVGHAPPPRRIERRKIIALRLATLPERIPGSQLRAALEAEALQHGKYSVFHKLADNGEIVFSVASMVEPGIFDLEKMPDESYPGVTLFAQLPGPIAGMLAFNELIACSRRLQAALGGTLQDERGVPLTVHRIERIRQEIREFEHRLGGDAGLHASPLGS